MRFLVIPGALLVLLTGVAWPAADSSRPLRLAAPGAPPARPLAFLSQDAGTRLTAIDPHTLRAIRPRSVPLGAVDAWAFAPDGNHLALAVHDNPSRPDPDSIRLVRLPTLKLVKRPARLDAEVRALLWDRPDRIVAFVGYCCPSTFAIEVVDPTTRRLVGRQELNGAVVAVGRSADSLVLLATPDNAIGPSQLVVVAGDGVVRTVGLERIAAGYSWPDSSTDPIGTQRIPGLAVDQKNDRAYVIPADGPAAEVDLRTLGVSYHQLSEPRSVLSKLAGWLQPSAQAKGLNGPARQARWLGDGLIALTGSNETATRDASGQASFASSPAGLAIVDTNEWTLRMLDSGADSATVADGALLVTGRTWLSGSQETRGMGLAVYGPDRALRYRLWLGASAWVQAVWAGRAYMQVTSAGTARTFVVELGSGRILGERRSAIPVPLPSAGPDS